MEWNASTASATSTTDGKHPYHHNRPGQGHDHHGRGGGGRGYSGPNSYSCTRCGLKGHQMKFCPTIGDPKYDTDNRLVNIPKNTILTVDNLDGIDTTNKMVFLLLFASLCNRIVTRIDCMMCLYAYVYTLHIRIVTIENNLIRWCRIKTARTRYSTRAELALSGWRERYTLSKFHLHPALRNIEWNISESHVTVNFEMSEVPDDLKCALTAKFLREAVTLRCCQKVPLLSPSLLS